MWFSDGKVTRHPSKHLQAPTIQVLTSVLVQKEIDTAGILKKNTDLVVENRIDIPRIIIPPNGTVIRGYRVFALDMGLINKFKLAKGQLKMYYKKGTVIPEYVPILSPIAATAF